MEAIEPTSPTAGLADVLRAHSAAIVERWANTVRRLPVAADLATPVLIDHVPELLAHIAGLATGVRRDSVRDEATGHAALRLEEGFALADVISELRALREAVLSFWSNREIAVTDVRVLDRAIDDSIAAAVHIYTSTRERALREVEAFTEAVLRNAPLAVRVYDERGTVLLANERYAALAGRTTEDLEGRSEQETRVWLSSRPTDAPAAAGRAELEQTVHVGADERIFLTEQFSIAGPGGRRTCEVSKDITERKRVEADQQILARASYTLSTELDTHATLRALARVAVPVLGDWCLIDLLHNDGAMERVSVAHSDSQMLNVVDEYASKYPPSWEERGGSGEVMRTGKSLLVPEIDLSTLTNAVRPEGLKLLEQLGLRSYVVAPLTARGRILGAITVVATAARRRFTLRDQRLVEELGRRAGICVDNARLHGALQREVQQRERILAIVSHDLRNPLASVFMAAPMALTAAVSDAQRRHLEAILRSAQTMDLLINDLLDVASIDAGRLKLDPRPHPVVHLVEEAVEQHRGRAERAGITLQIEAGGAGAVVCFCDHARLLQVLGNLIGNALKFCARGDRVVVSVRRLRDAVEIEVADSGPGIPSSSLAHIFDPFFSAPGNEKRGTGLGLFIAKGIIESHGGALRAGRSEQGGASFVVRLPLTA